MDDYEADDSALLAAAANFDRSSSRPTDNPSTTKPPSSVVQPTPQPLPHARQPPSSILVNPRQKGNPILTHIRSLPWEYTDIQPDYVLGSTTCALFLSLKYHRLHPEYIYSRIRDLGRGSYALRVLLCMVDIQNHEESLKELSKTSMINNLTLILAWSAQEAGRYLELFKSYEHASPASIRAHQASNYRESLTEFVTTPRQINKTDAASLISSFGSLRNAVNAGVEELSMVPGFGEKKVRVWHGVMREEFRVKRARRRNIDLERRETTGSGGDADGESEMQQTANLERPVPIPISSIPSREATRSSVSRENTRPGSSGGGAAIRPRSSRAEEIRAEDLDYDEDLGEMDVQTAVDATVSTRVRRDEDAPDNVPKRDEPKLTDGVAAALEKLRRQNG